jgi:hypothetical protein
MKQAPEHSSSSSTFVGVLLRRGLSNLKHHVLCNAEFFFFFFFPSLSFHRVAIIVSNPKMSFVPGRGAVVMFFLPIGLSWLGKLPKSFGLARTTLVHVVPAFSWASMRRTETQVYEGTSTCRSYDFIVFLSHLCTFGSTSRAQVPASLHS